MVRKIKTKVFLKIFSVFLFLLLLGAYANIFALFDGQKYAPGATLDPECAPTDTNCTVAGNPWLTSSSGIYHEGNVNVGVDTASVSTSISGGSILTSSIVDSVNPNSLNMMPSIAVGNDGNPIIAYYLTEYSSAPAYNFVPRAEASGDGTSLVLMFCLDTNCSSYDDVIIDSGFYTETDQKINMKVDSLDRVHLSYIADYNLHYSVCSAQGVCENSGDMAEMNYYSHSTALDSDNNPYIIFSSYDDDENDIVSIAKQNDAGNGDSCYYYDENLDDYVLNPDWDCNVVAMDSSNSFFLSEGGLGDFMYIDEEDGFPRFITNYQNSYGEEYITYNVCNDADCTAPASTIVDLINSNSYPFEFNLATSLSVNSQGIPYIAYVVAPPIYSGGGDEMLFNNNSLFNTIGFIKRAEASTSDAINIFLAYLNVGNGSGCSDENPDWTCSQITDTYSTTSQEGYYSLDLEIDDNDIPQISASRYVYDDRDYILDYIKCLDEVCSNIETTQLGLMTSMFPGSAPISSSISIDGSSKYFSYIDASDGNIVLVKSGEAEGVSFGSGSINNNLYTGGDLGISGNLFIDGSVATSGGLYLNNGIPDNTNNVLYNNGGDLYWGGVSLSDITVGPDLTLGTDSSVSGILRIASQYGGTTTLQTYNDYGGSDYGAPTITLPRSSGVLVTTNGSVNYANSAGRASELLTYRSIYGNSFNGSANVTGTIAPMYGGTGLTSLTANSLIVGNGTSAVNLIAPSTSGNVLTSNGTSWVSQSLSISTTPSTLHIGGYITSPINYSSYVFTVQDDTSGIVLKRTNYDQIPNNEPFILLLDDSISSGGEVRGLHSGGLRFTDNHAGVEYMRVSSNGISTTGSDATASLHLKAGTATAGTAPLKLTSGTALTTTEAGAIEFHGGHLYFTATNGGSRYQLDQQSSGGGLSSDSDFNTKGGTNAGLNLVAGAQYNTFLGYEAGKSGVTSGINASNNTAVGYQSLYSNITGSRNTTNGYQSLYFNTTGTYNTANGYVSLSYNTTGSYNTANGSVSLLYNTTGSNNTALGYNSGSYYGSGTSLNQTSSNSLYLGYDTRASANGNTNEIVIGYGTVGNGSNTTTIGNTSTLRTYLTGLNLKAGTSTAGTAPLKLTSGTALTTTEAGAIEFHGGHLYFTATNGGSRYQLDQQSSGGGLSSDSDFNTKGGTNAGLNLVAGAQYNTFLGYEAGLSSPTLSTDDADRNTAVGYRALYSNTQGFDNTANGYYSLYSNTQGVYNTANGNNSLRSNTTGHYNTANGHASLFSNTTGYSNTANGHASLFSNTTGYYNTANGHDSLSSNTTGYYNTANGHNSLHFNTNGSNNTANGVASLYFNTTGSNNTANGYYSLFNTSKTLTAGSFITGVSYTIISTGTTDFTICGASNSTPGTVFTKNAIPCTGTGTASSNSNNNVAEGYNSGMYIANGSTALTASSNSLFLGADTKALIDGSTNEIVIGYNTIGNGSNTTTIGTGNVLYVGGSSITGKVARFTNSAGYCDIDPLTASLVCSSDIFLKKNITTLDTRTEVDLNNSILTKENIDFVLNKQIEIPDTILEKINLLTPVTYNWNTEEDGTNKHIGFIAQEVEQLFPDLVFTDKDRINPLTGEGLKSIAYSNLIPYTIKAIQEMNLKVEGLNNFELDEEGNTIVNSFRDSIVAWLGNVENGIKSVFFGEVHTDQICVKRADGTERCVTGDELDTVLGSETESMENNSDYKEELDGDVLNNQTDGKTDEGAETEDSSENTGEGNEGEEGAVAGDKAETLGESGDIEKTESSEDNTEASGVDGQSDIDQLGSFR